MPCWPLDIGLTKHCSRRSSKRLARETRQSEHNCQHATLLGLARVKLSKSEAALPDLFAIERRGFTKVSVGRRREEKKRGGKYVSHQPSGCRGELPQERQQA